MGDKVRSFRARWRAPNDGINVCARQCSRCLFGPRPHLTGMARRKKIADALESGSETFTCHEWANVACRGFFNAYRTRALAFRLGDEYGKLAFRTRKDACRTVGWLRDWFRW